MLSALLSGTALDVYARLSNEDAANYNKIKTALQKQYKMTEQGFRLKFTDNIPEGNENPGQFVTRLNHYLDRWKWLELQTMRISNHQRTVPSIMSQKCSYSSERELFCRHNNVQ